MKIPFLLSFIISIGFQSSFSQNSISWTEINKSKKGTISVVWFPNKPFGYKDDGNGEMKGIEVDIINGFQKYLKNHYQIDLSIQWLRKEAFTDVLAQMKSNNNAGVFGVAGFSISNERRSFMKFSPSYMADITVLVSTDDIPIVKSKEDLAKYLNGTTAITAPGTLLEQDLILLKEENKMNFNIEYAANSYEFIKLIRNRKKSFGYLSLPVYLMDLEKGLTNLNRQNYLTKRYEGRGLGLSKTSDWDVPLNEYFGSTEFKQNIEFIIGSYVNIDLYHFIETFNPENEVSLLNKEKDIQQMEINFKELLLKDKNQRQVYLTIIISAVTILLLIIVFLFRRQLHTHRLLIEQKSEIEAQSDQILSINNNLENIIRERTHELETKNKALEEYAFITAHKLRAPLASILGLVTLVERMKLLEEDKIVVMHLSQSAKKLDEIIHSVMNAIDKGDSPN